VGEIGSRLRSGEKWAKGLASGGGTGTGNFTWKGERQMIVKYIEHIVTDGDKCDSGKVDKRKIRKVTIQILERWVAKTSRVDMNGEIY